VAVEARSGFGEAVSGHVIVSGASGLIGTALVAPLRADGVDVRRLVRRPPRGGDEIAWQPGRGELDPGSFAGALAVVNLSGASIGRLPWTRSYRRTLIESRLQSTRTLAAVIRRLGTDPPALVSASAVGFYGSRPGETLTEAAPAGATFLARLSADWEREAAGAGPHARVALLRTAPILHPPGVLKPLITLARLGLSGPLGAGRQIWPWISLEDEVRAIRHIIDRGLGGPVNLSGPEPASANEIGRELAHALHRPYLLPAPNWALRLALGRDAADSLLLSDARVVPEALTRSGFEFRQPTARAAIGRALAAEGRTDAR